MMQWVSNLEKEVLKFHWPHTTSSNVNLQGFCGSPYSKPSHTNNRKLLLSTGVSIIVESDSEEEEMPQLRAPRTLSALRGTTNVSCTQWYRQAHSNTAVILLKSTQTSIWTNLLLAQFPIYMGDGQYSLFAFLVSQYCTLIASCDLSSGCLPAPASARYRTKMLM